MLPNRSFPFIMNFNHDLPTMQVQVGNSIVLWNITLQSSIIINHHHRRHHVGLAFRLFLACSVSLCLSPLPCLWPCLGQPLASACQWGQIAWAWKLPFTLGFPEHITSSSNYQISMRFHRHRCARLSRRADVSPVTKSRTCSSE